MNTPGSGGPEVCMGARGPKCRAFILPVGTGPISLLCHDFRADAELKKEKKRKRKRKREGKEGTE